ncbi:Uncharacterised protein [Vibrio cholerae]|nr:Uncharacterised protein [Vibrio cholerae]
MVTDFEATDFHRNIHRFSRDCARCHLVTIRRGDFELVVDGFGHGIAHVVLTFTGGTRLLRRVH